MIETLQTILIVEDSIEYYQLAVRALEEAGLRNPLRRCGDGDEALDFLRHRGAYRDPASAPRPCAILLDLNLPGTDGRGVLQELKQDTDLRMIPVIILSTSTDDRDVNDCYGSGANSYVHKPVDLKAFIAAMQHLKDFWFEVAVLPRN